MGKGQGERMKRRKKRENRGRRALREEKKRRKEAAIIGEIMKEGGWECFYLIGSVFTRRDACECDGCICVHNLLKKLPLFQDISRGNGLL